MTTPATNFQIPDHAILDFYNKQNYLGNRYVYASPSASIGATTETPLILLKNAAVTATGFPKNFVSLFCDFRKVTCLTTGQTAFLNFYLNPTVTGAGTAKTAVNTRPASTNASVAAISLNPTVSANGTLVGSISSTAFIPNTANTLFILDPGQTLLVTVTASSNTANVAVETSWYEL